MVHPLSTTAPSAFEHPGAQGAHRAADGGFPGASGSPGPDPQSVWRSGFRVEVLGLRLWSFLGYPKSVRRNPRISCAHPILGRWGF